MNKRLCSFILAVLIILCSFVCTFAADAEYYLTFEKDYSVNVSDSLKINFNLKDKKDSKRINTLYMTLKYDPEILKFEGVSNGITVVEKEKGNVKIIYYGDPISLGNIFIAEFKGIKEGSSQVYVESCVCDTRKNSISEDAKPVNVSSATSLVKVEKKETYDIEVSDGITYKEAPQKGKDFIFSLKDTDRYKYSDLKVTAGGKDVTDKIIKLSDGSYMFPSEYVTGDIKITVKRDRISKDHGSVIIDTGTKDCENEQNPETGAFVPDMILPAAAAAFICILDFRKKH